MRRDSFGSCSSFLCTFSIITIAASTSVPIAIAMPPSDMMLALMPCAFITMKADATAIGVTITTISPERRWNRNTKQTSATTRNSSSSLPLRWSTARWISEERSYVVDDLDALRQACAQLIELGLDPHDGVARVVAVAHDDHATDGLALAVEFADAPAHLGSEPHFRHVAQQHGRAALRRHHRDASRGRRCS